MDDDPTPPTTPGASLTGVFAKIEQAKKHLRDLEVQVRAFLDLEPYQVVTERDTENGEYVVLVRVSREVPLKIGATIGDLVHNLRSALDHLAWQLVIAGGGKPGRYTAFPVFARLEDYQAMDRRRLEGMWDGSVRLIESVQPYTQAVKADEHPFYLIHHLDRRDKHQLLNVVGCAVIGMGVGIADPQHGFFYIDKLQIMPRRTMTPLLDRTELARFSQRNVNVKLHLNFDLAFDERGPGKGKPVISTVQQLIGFTEQTIGQFAICFC